MINFLSMDGYGVYVFSAFVFTMVNFLGLYLIVRYQLKKEQQKFAEKFRSGNVHVNGAGPDFNAPFGGYKKSGNGREWGDLGFEEFLEIKAILGYNAA